MPKSGIIDPAKVTRGTVEGAASFTAMFLTGEVLMVEIAEPQTAMPTDGMGGTI